LEAAALATEYGDDESEAVEENVPRDELP
jgi:hypothetical protein